MSVEGLMVRKGTLVTVTDGTDDVYGNPTEQIVEHSVDFELQQYQRSESGGADEWQIGKWRLFMPLGTSAKGADRFHDDQGNEYGFVGPPDTVFNPRLGRFSHTEAVVERVT